MKRNLIALMLVASPLAGCQSYAPGTADRGVEPVNVPVVQRQDYALDLAVPNGGLPMNEAERLDGWFRSLELGYGDSIYVDGPYAGGVRDDIARVAGRYGLLISDGAPVTAGGIAPGSVRVVVSRTRASVPGCPDWSRPASPNWDNNMMPSFGCGVNGNLAAMVANPEDLVHGRGGSGVADTQTTTKALQYYRSAEPTGKQGLKDTKTKKGDQ